MFVLACTASEHDLNTHDLRRSVAHAGSSDGDDGSPADLPGEIQLCVAAPDGSAELQGRVAPEALDWAPDCRGDIPAWCELGARRRGGQWSCRCDNDGDCRSMLVSMGQHAAARSSVCVDLDGSGRGRCQWGAQ